MSKVLLGVFTLSVSLIAQTQSQPLTRAEACKKFLPAVVEIDVPPGPDGPSAGTGFIVSLDGWVLTAAHVVVDAKTQNYFPTIELSMDYGNVALPLVPVTPIADALRSDVAVLKVKGTLPKYLNYVRAASAALDLGDQSDVQVGEDVLLVGSPLREGMSHLCMFGSVAATSRGGPVYYQGPAVQGMSGGPVISLASGKVIGIIDQRGTDLTGLSALGNRLAQAGQDKQNAGDPVSRQAISGVIQILENQMNNGIGMAVGVSWAHFELNNATKAQNTGSH